MNNLRIFGYFCLGIVIFLEIGGVIGNLIEGESPFYLFDIKYKFSFDNSLFIPYWGSLIGLIFFIREFKSIDDFDKIFEKLESKSELHSDKSTSSNKTKFNYDTFPRSDIPGENDQRFRQFLREQGLSYLECSHKWESYWKQKYRTWSPQSNSMNLSKNFKQFLSEKNLTIEEFKNNPSLWVDEYEKWLKRN